ncbi:hypothetical protein THIOSC13_920002 [uncultured Thiomicrorhabdus sp.]
MAESRFYLIPFINRKIIRFTANIEQVKWRVYRLMSKRTVLYAQYHLQPNPSI